MSLPAWSRRGWLEGVGTGGLLGLLGCAGAPVPAGEPAMKPAPTAAPSPTPPTSAPPAGGGFALVDPAIAAYAEDHSAPESEVMRAIAAETIAATEWSIMMVGPLEGTLLRLLVRLRGARRVLEVGTFTGYSAIAMAEGLPDDGQLVTLDVSEEWTAIARKHWARSPHGRKISLKLGPAADTIPTLQGSFDLAFIDADKENYPVYWDLIVPKMSPGGLIVVDNVLAGGAVVAPSELRGQRMAAFNAKVRADPRVEILMLPLRDGVTLARLRGGAA